MTISKAFYGNVDTTTYDDWLLDEHVFSIGDKVILDLGIGSLCDEYGRERDLVGIIIDVESGDTHALVEWQLGDGQAVVGQTPIDSLAGVFN